MDNGLKEILRLPEKYAVQPFWLGRDIPIFIYGTGTVGQDIYRVFAGKNIHVTGFMDHRPRETSFVNDVQVYQPHDEKITSAMRKQAVIILAIHNREVYIPAIIDNLKGLGYNNFVSMIDLYDFFSQDLGTRYWLTKRDFYSKFESEIDAVYDLLADETSREVFSATLRFRMTGDFTLLPIPDREHQYCPPDLPVWKSPLRLIDCGAYDGDAIRDLIKSGYTINALAAIEPDQANFSKLSSYLKENPSNIPESVLFPCGVYSQTTQLHFSSRQGEASGITTTGDSMIQCIALDDVLPNFAPTLIKMDIEGAELEALVGAKEIIKNYQPGLAISAYHAPEHIWQIPMLINEIAKDSYTFRLRAHAYNCFDTVLYAIPIH
jgi:FkbM family methyltransferase